MIALQYLKDRSPALFGELNRRFSATEVEKIAEEFMFAEQEKNASFEKNLVREPGVNFNPRAARVLQLILESQSLQDTNALSTALKILGGEDLSPHAKDSINLPYAAILLDDLRHLHMSTLSTAEKITELQRLIEIKAQLANNSEQETGTLKLLAKCELQAERLKKILGC